MMMITLYYLLEHITFYYLLIIIAFFVEIIKRLFTIFFGVYLNVRSMFNHIFTFMGYLMPKTSFSKNSTDIV